MIYSFEATATVIGTIEARNKKQAEMRAAEQLDDFQNFLDHNADGPFVTVNGMEDSIKVFRANENHDSR